VRLRHGLTIEDSVLVGFAKRWGIRRLALYGSVLREDFGPSSDIDMLVEFSLIERPGCYSSPKWN
jgi:predicted nucleotidyltransferase